MAASSDMLGSLHELFAQYWMDMMNRSEDVYNDSGDLVGARKIPLSAAEAAVLRAFLKDNNVQADPALDGDVRALSHHLREATSGEVSEAELDSILEGFMQSQPGLGNMQ